MGHGATTDGRCPAGYLPQDQLWSRVGRQGAFGDSLNEFSLTSLVNGLAIAGHTIQVSDAYATHASITCAGTGCVGATVTNASPGNASGGGAWNVVFNGPATFHSLVFAPANGVITPPLATLPSLTRPFPLPSPNHQPGQ